MKQYRVFEEPNQNVYIRACEPGEAPRREVAWGEIFSRILIVTDDPQSVANDLLYRGAVEKEE